MKIIILGTNGSGINLVTKLVPELKTKDSKSFKITILNQPSIDTNNSFESSLKQLKSDLPQNVQINLINDDIQYIYQSDNEYQIKTKNDIYNTDKVIISDSQLIKELDSSQASLAKYSQNNSLNQMNSILINQNKLEAIKPHQNVIIHGLGNRFFNYINLLTEERDGNYEEQKDGSLKYRPSGAEPYIIAGSDRGVPNYPQTDSPNDYKFYFLNEKKINQIVENNQTISYSQLIQLLKHEVELNYYQSLIQRNYSDYDPNKFKEAFIKAENPNQVINKYDFKQNEILNWQLILNPVAGLKITTIKEYQNTLLEWMDSIIKDIDNDGPITSSLAIINQMNDIIKFIIDNQLLDKDSYQKQFKPLFKITTDFLANGPTGLQMKKLKALIEAGIVTILGPRMKIVGANQQFMTISMFYAKEIFKAKNLIETAMLNEENTIQKSINDFFVLPNHSEQELNKLTQNL